MTLFVNAGRYDEQSGQAAQQSGQAAQQSFACEWHCHDESWFVVLLTCAHVCAKTKTYTRAYTHTHIHITKYLH